MKYKLDKVYMKKIKYYTLGFVIIYLIYAFIDNLSIVMNTLNNFLRTTIRILSPLIWGIIIAYLLYPIVVFIEKQFRYLRRNKVKEISKDRRKIIRLLSVSTAFIIVLLVLFLTVYGMYVMINGQFKGFDYTEVIHNIENYFAQYSAEIKGIGETLGKMGVSKDFVNVVNGLSENVNTSIQGLISILAASAGKIGKYIIDISFGVVFAINILYNQEYFTKLSENTLILLFSEKRKKSIMEFADEINNVFIGFIRGKILDLTLLSFFTALALVIIRVDFALLLGMFAGYTNIIPYLGTWIGIIPAVIIAYANNGLQNAFFVGLYIVLVQQAFIVIVSPKVQGKSIGIHPFFALLAITILGSLFGLIGMIFAIPIAGVIKVIVLKWANSRKDKLNLELHELEEYK